MPASTTPARSRSRTSALAALAALLAAGAVAAGVGCDGDGDEEEGGGPPTTAAPPATGPGATPASGDRPATGNGRGGVELERVGTFEQPVYVAQPASDRDHLYIVERCGRVVRAPTDGAGGEAFLDVADEVTCDGSEQGLLSVAFHPGYERNRRFYVYFTDTAGDERIVEYRREARDAGAADRESARELLHTEDFAANHNGGQLQFGPDGMLYAGTGDGGGAGDPERTAQDRSSLLGKLLRLDAQSAGSEPEIVAYGLRNPWRFSFDRATGDLWIGDVGQDAREEVDAIAAGELDGPGLPLNFGWSAFEGTQRFNTDQEAPQARAPVHEYPLEGSNCAVTGGYVVRDRELASLYGRYLYGDYCVGELRSFSARPALRSGAARDDRALGLRVPSLSSFAEDVAGRVYAISLDGPVYRLAAQ